MRSLLAVILVALTFHSTALAAGNDDPALMLDMAVERIKEKDYEKANVILVRLAKENEPGGLYHLGRAYKSGWGVKKNASKALKLFSRAYQVRSTYQGPVAYEIGRLFQLAKTDEGYKTAIEWFKRSLRHGHAKAASQLGVLYAQGRGVARDHARAAAYFKVAARAGNGASMIAYARYLRQGRYVEKNTTEADRWTRKAIGRLSAQAKRGSASAAIRVGRLYLEGEGVRQDLDEAEKWLRLAEKRGDRRAKTYLDQIANLNKAS